MGNLSTACCAVKDKSAGRKSEGQNKGDDQSKLECSANERKEKVYSVIVMASAAAIPQVDPAAPAPAPTESHAVTDAQPPSD